METPQKQNVTYGIKGTKVRTLTKTDNKKPFFSSSNIGCACLCIGLYLILLLIDSCNDNSNATPTSSDAWYMAQQFIKQDLKAPTTAKFPYSSANGVKILDLGNGKFSVSGYVDAENSFGAKIRNYFTITIWKKPNSDTWYSSGIIWHR